MSDIKMEVETSFRCPKCNGEPYRLYRRQVKPGAEVFEHLLWPTDPSVPPPLSNTDLRCPNCNVTLERK